MYWLFYSKSIRYYYKSVSIFAGFPFSNSISFEPHFKSLLHISNGFLSILFGYPSSHSKHITMFQNVIQMQVYLHELA